MAESKIKITAEDNASSVFRQIDKSLAGLAGSFGGLGAASAAFGAVIGGAAIISGLTNIVNALDDLDEAAQGIGVAASSLSAFQLSARAAGVDSNQFTTSISKLNVKIAEAAGGNEKAVALFKALGISLKDSSGNLRNTEQILGDVADRFSTFNDGLAKNALAVDLFGRAGARMTAFLNQGREGLTKFGGVSEEAIQSAVKLQSEIDKLSTSWEKLKLSVGGATAAIVNSFIAISGSESENSSDKVLARLQMRVASLRKELETQRNPEMIQAANIELRETEALITRIQDQARAFLRRDRGDQGRVDAPIIDEKAAEKAKKAQEALAKLRDDELKRELFRLKLVDDAEEKATEAFKRSEEEAQKTLERIARESKAFQDSQDARLESLRFSLETQLETENRTYLERSFALIAFREDELITEREFQDLREKAEQDHQQRLFDIEEEEARRRFGINRLYRKLDFDSAGFFLNQLSALMNSKSRSMFEVGKAAAIGETVINTYKSATAAFSAMAGIPYVGPILGAIAAAAAIAAGLANVQRIRSTSFGGGAAAGGAVPVIPGQGRFDVPSPTANASVTARQRQTINVTLVGSAFSARQIRDELLPLLNEAISDGADLLVTQS